MKKIPLIFGFSNAFLSEELSWGNFTVTLMLRFFYSLFCFRIECKNLPGVTQTKTGLLMGFFYFVFSIDRRRLFKTQSNIFDVTLSEKKVNSSHSITIFIKMFDWVVNATHRKTPFSRCLFVEYIERDIQR